MASRPVLIPAATAATVLDAQQQQFNQLIADIGRQRQLLAEWQGAMAGARQRHARDVAPLQAAQRAALTALAQHLDNLSDSADLGRATRRSLDEAIARLCAGSDDAVLQELCQRHGPQADDATPDQETAEPPTDDWQAQQEHARRQREAERRAHHGARQAAARARQQQAAPATQSLRQVYRRLASSLHPDREPDPAERARKTALMQRANQAYAAGQLLELLQLQLEAEHIAPAHLARLGQTQLAHYNQVLTEQLQALRQQVQAEEQQARQAFGIAPGERCKPARLAALLRAHAQALQQHTLWLQQALRTLVAEPDTLPPWLRELQRAMRDWDDVSD